MWIRVLMAGLVSVATMGGLYALLFGLVEATTEVPHIIIAKGFDFKRLKIDSQVASNRPTKPKREPTRPQPDTPPIAIWAANTVTSGPTPTDVVGVGRGGIKPDKMELGNLAGVDHEVIPLVRIQPQYPPRASVGGIEGWVRCQFNITPAGAVVDATVTDSEPRGMFDRAALEAVSRWKYKPKVEGGVAVELRGVQVLLTFKLEK